MEKIKVKVGFAIPYNCKARDEYISTWIKFNEHISWLFSNGTVSKHDTYTKADTFELIIFFIIELTEKQYVFYQLKYNDAKYPLISTDIS